MPIQFRGVNSRNLAAVGYDPDSQEMHVLFTNGTTYRYDNVMPEHAEGLQSAQSPGSYFAAEIKSRYNGTAI